MWKVPGKRKPSSVKPLTLRKEAQSPSRNVSVVHATVFSDQESGFACPGGLMPRLCFAQIKFTWEPKKKQQPVARLDQLLTAVHSGFLYGRGSDFISRKKRLWGFVQALDDH